MKFLFGIFLLQQIRYTFSYFFSSSSDQSFKLVPLTITTGVAPKDINKYTGDSFACDTDKVIPISSINDDYCDCLDGTDEPGTNACVQGKFYCQNSGYKPLTIPSSRVEDGICDCCDGSDERSGERIKCSNTCATEALKEKEKIQYLKAAYNQGSLIRQENILKLRNELEPKANAIDIIKEQVIQQTKIVEELQVLYDDVIAKKNMEKDNYESTVIQNLLEAIGYIHIPRTVWQDLLVSLFKVVNLTNAEIHSYFQQAINEDHQSNTSQPTENLSDPTDTYSDDEDDEEDDEDHIDERREHAVSEQDQAGEDESIPPRILTERVNAANNGVENTSTGPTCIFRESTIQDERLMTICAYVQDLIAKVDPAEGSNFADEQVEPATPESIENEVLRMLLLSTIKHRKSYKEIQWLLGYYHMHGNFNNVDLFVQNQMSNMVLDIDGQAQLESSACPLVIPDRSEEGIHMTTHHVCTMARKLESHIYGYEQYMHNFDTHHNDKNEYAQSLDDAKKTLRDLQTQEQNAEMAISKLKQYNDYLAYVAYEHETFSVIDSHFTYTVKMMDKVSQKDNEQPHNSEVNLGQFYKIKNQSTGGGQVLYYKDGQYCHAFGPRTAEVRTICGAENKVLSAREPSTCFYVLEMESPAACTPAFAEENGLLM